MKKSLPSSLPRTNKLLKTEWGDVKFQAWGLGDQSKLLLALSGPRDEDNSTVLFEALREIIESCVLEYSGGDVLEMPLFLSEMVLVSARAMSIGEIAKLTKVCNVEDCKGNVPMEIDLSKAKLVSDGDSDNTYTIGEYTFELRYPSFRGTLEINDLTDATDLTEDLLRKFIKSVYTESEVWVMADYTAAEQKTFMKLLGADFQVHVMNKFVKNMPYVLVVAEGVCEKCGHVHKQDIKGVSKLFGN